MRKAIAKILSALFAIWVIFKIIQVVNIASLASGEIQTQAANQECALQLGPIDVYLIANGSNANRVCDDFNKSIESAWKINNPERLHKYTVVCRGNFIDVQDTTVYIVTESDTERAQEACQIFRSSATQEAIR